MYKDGKYIGYIYKITCLENSKIYIGQTMQEFNKRMIGHLSKANTSATNSPLHLAIRKYGWDNFSKEIIKTIECDSKEELRDELNEYEIYYISKYDSLVHHNGYNISKGGNYTNYLEKGIDVYDFDGVLLNSFENKFLASDFYGVSAGSIQNNCMGETMVAKNSNVIFRYKGDPFDKYDSLGSKYRNRLFKFKLDGTFVGEYENAVIAGEEFKNISNNPGGVICGAVLNRTGIAFGYYWNREKSFDFDIKNYRNYVPIKAYDPKIKELVKSYKCTMDAAIEVCGKRSGAASIIRSCNGINHYPVYGYIWRYEQDEYDTYPVYLKRLSEESIDKYTLLGEFVGTYENSKQAAILSGFNESVYDSIQKCATGKIITSMNFIWRIHNHPFDEFPTRNPKLRMINCYDMDDNYIMTFASGNDAGRWLSDDEKFHQRSNQIRACCSHYYGCNSAYGYKWFYIEDELNPDKSKIIITSKEETNAKAS